jgi:hypothetical protein
MVRGAGSRATLSETWPSLPYEEWKPTLDTLHMWAQIVGKVKLALAPFINDWWQVPLTLTARGLTTSTIPYRHFVFQVDFDFIDHRLDIEMSNGGSRSIPLRAQAVADFYRAFMAALWELDIDVKIATRPVEVRNTIPFDQDEVHAAYDREYVERWWQILVAVERLLEQYRSRFAGKSSPVQFWWGTFDLSVTRYSGRPAPTREYPTRWLARGKHWEIAECGFWPGNDKLPEPAFYAFTSPEPAGCRTAVIQPSPAGWHPELSEFVLRYEAVRRSATPEQMLLDFFNSTYAAGADLAGWDRDALDLT